MLIRELQNTFAQPGRVVSLVIRPGRALPVEARASVEAVANQGLMGDRSRGGNRQVTLIQQEHLAATAACLGQVMIDGALTRRNIVTAGINLIALKGKQFWVGNALLEYTGECHPCSRMEEALGPGGYNAMRGHGGITARILVSGTVHEGDAVRVHDEETTN